MITGYRMGLRLKYGRFGEVRGSEVEGIRQEAGLVFGFSGAYNLESRLLFGWKSVTVNYLLVNVVQTSL